MKYIKKFNEEQDEKSIEDWCEEFNLKDYNINEYNSVDINTDGDISGKGLKKIPIEFGIVKGYFCCDDNHLTSLSGCPRVVNGNFWCYNNKLINLIGGPEEVINEYYNCEDNKLISLEGMPIGIEYSITCSFNPIYYLYSLFIDHKSYVNSLDYNYLRGTNIIKHRFQEACEEAGIKMPEYIQGYKYI